MAADRQGNEPDFVAFRVEPRGANGYIVLIDGVEAWRGSSPDQPLTEAVTKAAADTKTI